MTGNQKYNHISLTRTHALILSLFHSHTSAHTFTDVSNERSDFNFGVKKSKKQEFM